MKVLLADDERIIREGIAGSIDWKAVECELVGAAADGMEAFKLYREKHPDCVVTDIRMPLITGLELIKIIKEGDRSCRFVILSGYDEFEFARTAMQYGVRDYLLKPFDDEELSDVLVRLRCELENDRFSKESGQESTGNHDIDTLLAFLKIHYRRRELSLSWISQSLIYKNTDYLGKLFKKKTGQSFNSYLAILRINKAKEILKRAPKTTVADLSEAVGYPSEGSYFCTHFKQICGKTVTIFRETLNKSE